MAEYLWQSFILLSLSYVKEFSLIGFPNGRRGGVEILAIIPNVICQQIYTQDESLQF